ncbi:MAG TPA: DUF2867 domain-containing protein [Acidimicrobiales bacterium]|nr:DUF2867 domain-containing protein [Acidimicrobiales bacterium]
MIIAIAGASGFVGRALTVRLLESNHDVIALHRSVRTRVASERSVVVDLGDEIATARALTNVDAAFYLVHSMAGGDEFRDLDLRLATAFSRTASQAGVSRIIYVGALGDAPSSAHLSSRHEVGAALRNSGVDVVELRAAVVFGAGSISFEMLRYLTERLPVMVCPRWVRTRIQPIALVDLLDYLEQSLFVAPGVYEIGGADVTTYREMISEYARARGLHTRFILDIPWLTPHLSSYWVDLVTPVDRSVSHALIESLVTEVVVVNGARTKQAFSVVPMTVERALVAALDQQDEEVARSLFTRRPGQRDGVYTVAISLAIPVGLEDSIRRDLKSIGGTLSWYGAAPGWALRLALGRVVGEKLRPKRPEALVPGALVDWWRIDQVDDTQLVLRSEGWFPGDAWLGYCIHEGSLQQVAAFRPRGIPGFIYWTLLGPFHCIVFNQMVRHRIRRTSAASPSH